jgi:hypothetical protein
MSEYERKCDEYKESMAKLKNIGLETVLCEPSNKYDKYGNFDGFKAKFIGEYSNGYKTSIKPRIVLSNVSSVNLSWRHIPTLKEEDVIKEQIKEPCLTFHHCYKYEKTETGAHPEFYAIFPLKDHIRYDPTKVVLEEPKNPTLLGKAKMSHTTILTFSVSSLGIPERKAPLAPDENQTLCWNVYQKKKHTLSRERSRFVLDEINNNKTKFTNKFEVLCDYNNELRILKASNFEVDVKKFKPDDINHRVKQTKKNKNIKTKIDKDIKNKNSIIVNINKGQVEKRMALKDVILCILNKKMKKEVSISDRKLLEEDGLIHYLKEGFYNKATTRMNKGHRKILTRLTIELIEDIIK